MKIKDLDAVALTHDLPEHGLKAGERGTVVHRYRDDFTFEIEFPATEAHPVTLLMLTLDDFRLVAEKSTAG